MLPVSDVHIHIIIHHSSDPPSTQFQGVQNIRKQTQADTGHTQVDTDHTQVNTSKL